MLVVIQQLDDSSYTDSIGIDSASYANHKIRLPSTK